MTRSTETARLEAIAHTMSAPALRKAMLALQTILEAKGTKSMLSFNEIDDEYDKDYLLARIGSVIEDVIYEWKEPRLTEVHDTIMCYANRVEALNASQAQKADDAK
jgi:hypothetical protein